MKSPWSSSHSGLNFSALFCNLLQYKLNMIQIWTDIFMKFSWSIFLTLYTLFKDDNQHKLLKSINWNEFETKYAIWHQSCQMHEGYNTGLYIIHLKNNSYKQNFQFLISKQPIQSFTIVSILSPYWNSVLSSYWELVFQLLLTQIRFQFSLNYLIIPLPYLCN